MLPINLNGMMLTNIQADSLSFHTFSIPGLGSKSEKKNWRSNLKE